MFITAVCVLFLIKLRWSKKKGVYAYFNSQPFNQARAYPGGMKRLGVVYYSLDGMLVHGRITPSIKFAGTYLYTWVERGTLRVQCLAPNVYTIF